MCRLLPKLRQDLGDAVTDGGWDGTDRVGRRPGSLWTPPQLPPGISSCLKPQRVFIRRPHRPEARLSALGSPAAVAWQEPKRTGLPAPGAGRPCSPEQWPLVVEASVPPPRTCSLTWGRGLQWFPQEASVSPGHAHPSSAGPPAGPWEPEQHGVWRHWAHTVETRREVWCYITPTSSAGLHHRVAQLTGEHLLTTE